MRFSLLKISFYQRSLETVKMLNEIISETAWEKVSCGKQIEVDALR